MTDDVVKDALIELLAIKLYEHSGGRVPTTLPSWLSLPEDVRENHRRVARGELPLDWQKEA